MEGAAALEHGHAARQEVDSAVVRFAGDSGDGMQLTGGRFTLEIALEGNDLATYPDFPAEIRAPAGTTFGVSAYQINFGAAGIKTAGDMVDVLVAMNPAALKVNLADVRGGGLIIADVGAFTEKNLQKAGCDDNPLDNGTLANFRVVTVDMSQHTLDAVKSAGLSKKEALRCKNMWALGLAYWLFERRRKTTVDWLGQKFASRPELAAANIAALNAGHAFGETSEMTGMLGAFTVRPAEIAPGLYRNVNGTEAMSWGLVAGAALAELPLMFCSYPITTFQAEDEIAAVCAAIGASYAGAMGVTSTSGPGMSLKTEGFDLAISTELPLVVVNTQRAGPSTGMPTKTEQADLLQAVYGRHGDSALVVLAARSPADCFQAAITATRLAVKYMTPVVLLSDNYIANASEPWNLPDVDKMARFPAKFREDPEDFHPFERDPDTLARPWAIPGTPGLEHRIGGLERDAVSGNISYDPSNHQRMTEWRTAKIAGIAKDIPAQTIDQGPDSGPMVVVGWGSTYGPISRAVGNLLSEGVQVSHVHLRHVWPLPQNLGELLSGFERILVPEMNMGQLVKLLRSELLVPAEGLNKVSGKPFMIAEIEAAMRDALGGMT
jgi:2-oxoglutarate ferredoxin oxidoreductase subunit alpha